MYVGMYVMYVTNFKEVSYIFVKVQNLVYVRLGM